MLKQYIGCIQMKNADKLFINTVGDEPMQITVKNKDLANYMYCKYVKVTVEEITKEEAIKAQREFKSKIKYI